MKLSELVKQKSTLQKSRPDKVSYTWAQFKSNIHNKIDNYSVLTADQQSHLQTKLKMVTSAFGHVKEYIDECIDTVTEQIKQLEVTAYSQSLKWYVEKKLPEEADPKQVKHKPIKLLEGNHHILDKRMKLYNDWRFPGICIQPRHGWMDNMASCDPLYMVDYDQAHCKSSLEVFKTHFQKRIRFYKQNVWHPKAQKIFENLPPNQFGFIMSFNWLNYVPREGIQKVYEEIFELLRPGGTFMHTYNNCEYHHTCGLYENGTHPYITSAQIKKLANSVGFELVFEHSDRGFDWMEIKKPGKLQSVKHGPALGKICRDPEVEQPEAKKRWNKKEVLAIQQEAIDIGIDYPKRIKTVYSLDTLVKKIHDYKVKQAKLKAKTNKQNQDKQKGK